MKKHISESIHGAILIGVIGTFAWLIGRPLIFPSLGPTAYVMVKDPDNPSHEPKAVISGHIIAVVAGLIGYHLFAGGLSLGVEHPVRSLAVLRIVVSGIFAMVVTSELMLWIDIDHSPATATTLIVALGLLQTFRDGLTILAAVVILVIIEEGVKAAPITLPRREDDG
jgi:CBS-domain-containing membrane protein